MSDIVESAMGGTRITQEQIKEWRELMSWSDGDEGLDAATVVDLLDEVERLQRELASTQRRLALRSAARHRGAA
jgi:hypothetical protein